MTLHGLCILLSTWNFPIDYIHPMVLDMKSTIIHLPDELMVCAAITICAGRKLCFCLNFAVNYWYTSCTSPYVETVLLMLLVFLLCINIEWCRDLLQREPHITYKLYVSEYAQTILKDSFAVNCFNYLENLVPCC